MLGQKLKKARLDLGYTLKKVEDIANEEYGVAIDSTSISKYESETREIPHKKLKILADIYGVDSSYLLGW